MYEKLKILDNITINFSEAGMNIINIVLAIIMFGVALGIRLDTFKEVFIKPKSVIIGLILQWIALPAITFLIIILLHKQITPMVALGMLLVASCPGGNISNFMSSFAKANVELSVSMTAITTACATFITPFNFALWGSLYRSFMETHISIGNIPTLTIAFMPMFRQVLILLGVPIVLGMSFSRLYPKLTEIIKKPFQYISLFFFIVMIGVSFSQNFDLFVKYISVIFVIVLIHNATALTTGFLGGKLFKVPALDRRSLCIEVGIQNSGLGLVLLFNPNIFPQEGIGGMLFVTAWWGIWHIISGLTISSIFRNRHIR